MKQFNFFAILLTCLAIAGCSDNSDRGANTRVTQQTAEGFRAEVVMETGVDLIPLDFLGWDLQLSNIAGQVVVMNFWASWCIPCMESFPPLIEMANFYPATDVRFISINLDDFEDEDAYISALDFLSSINADFENYHLLQDTFEVYDFFGLSGIPTLIVFDRTGQETNRFGIGGQELFVEEVAASINQALAQPVDPL